jgi:hypothetical protein
VLQRAELEREMDEELRSLQMDGRRILSFAVRNTAATVYKELAKNAMSKVEYVARPPARLVEYFRGPLLQNRPRCSRLFFQRLSK